MKNRPLSTEYNLPYEESEYNIALFVWAEEAEQEIRELKDVIRSMQLSIMAHPDCTEGSEFDDYAMLAKQALKK